MAIDISGTVEIKNGDVEISANNHIVNDGIIHLMGSMIEDWGYAYYGTSGWHAELGNDTTTATSASDTALAGTVISASEDTKSGDLNSGTDFYEVTYHFTWNAGSVTGTLGECGLWLNCQQNTGFDAGENSTQLLFSRLSSADGDFSSFVIDDSKPLTIDWTVKFQFV